MRKHPRFIETREGKALEIESFMDGKFRIAGYPGLFYDIALASFYIARNGKNESVSFHPKYPDLYKEWLRQEERRVRLQRKV